MGKKGDDEWLPTLSEKKKKDKELGESGMLFFEMGFNRSS